MKPDRAGSLIIIFSDELINRLQIQNKVPSTLNTGWFLQVSSLGQRVVNFYTALCHACLLRFKLKVVFNVMQCNWWKSIFELMGHAYTGGIFIAFNHPDWLCLVDLLFSLILHLFHKLNNLFKVSKVTHSVHWLWTCFGFKMKLKARLETGRGVGCSRRGIAWLDFRI